MPVIACRYMALYKWFIIIVVVIIIIISIIISIIIIIIIGYTTAMYLTSVFCHFPALFV